MPNALMIGVNYDLFWTLNPKSLTPFIKAFELKQQYDDKICWLNGFYNMMAIQSSFSKTAKYPKNPLNSDSKNKDKTSVSSQEEIKQKFMDTMIVLNSRFKKVNNDG